MGLSREQWGKIGYALIVFVIALASVFGYDLGVIQPREYSPLPLPPGGTRAVERIGIKCAEGSDPCVESWYGRDLNVYSDAGSTAKFTVDGATGNTAVAGTLTQSGAGALNGGITVDTNKFIVADGTGHTTIAGWLSVADVMTVTGATTLNGGLTMDTDKFTVADTSGNTSVGGTLTSAGVAALNAGITVDTNAFTVADTSGNTLVAGTFAANGGITVDTSAFTVADTSGNVATAGTLGVAGTTTLSGKVVGAPSGIITLADDFTLVPTRTVQLLQADGAIGGVVGTSGAVAGQLLYLVNVGAQNIVITDTGTMKLAGNATLTGDDAVQLIFDGTNWVQVSAVSAN